MKAKIFSIYITAGFTMLFASGSLFAQQTESLTVQKAIDMALQNNRLLHVKKLQVEEKEAKVREDHVKMYPAVTVNSTYQYNLNLGALVIPQGSFGALPLNGNSVSLPNEAKTFALGKHNNFNTGVTVYQPLSQLGKIRAAVAVAQTDVEMVRQEKVKASLQIRQAVERIFYGLLIAEKQKEEAQAKLDLANLKLYDVESALLSGKTIDVNKAGLQANIADEEQNILKLNIQTEDYTADLKHLTGITADSLVFEKTEEPVVQSNALENSGLSALSGNVDVKMAALGQLKTEQAIKIAELSYRPDVGLVAGYSYQTGNLLYPTNNPFIGAQFKWNIQDILSNKQVLKQRLLLSEQARENVAYTQDQVNNDVAKANRKLGQAAALIAVAQKAVTYRTEEMKVQQDKMASRLNLSSDVLQTRSVLAKAQADLLAAKLNYRLAQSDLEILIGND